MQSEQVRPVGTLAASLALALLAAPFGLALRVLLPTTACAYYAGVLAEEIILWGLPGLALRRKKQVHACTPVIGAAALAMGVCLQAALAAALTMLQTPGESAVLLPETAPEWVLAVLALVIAPAVCEEAFFRGALLGSLASSWPTGWALAASTLIFALMHGSWSGLPGHLAVGAGAGLLMLRTGGSWASVLYHLGFNGAALALAYCPRMDALLLLGLVWLAGFVWLARGTAPAAGKQIPGREMLLAAAVLAAVCLRYWHT